MGRMSSAFRGRIIAIAAHSHGRYGEPVKSYRPDGGPSHLARQFLIFADCLDEFYGLLNKNPYSGVDHSLTGHLCWQLQHVKEMAAKLIAGTY